MTRKNKVHKDLGDGWTACAFLTNHMSITSTTKNKDVTCKDCKTAMKIAPKLSK